MTTNNSVNTNLSGQTGTGAFAGSTSPVFTGPTLGAALATSINFGQSDLNNYTASSTPVPTITFVTPGDLSVAYPSTSFIYRRIGDAIIYRLRVQFTPTYTTASGAIRVGGFPVAANALSSGAGSFAVFQGGSTLPAFPAGTTFLYASLLASQTVAIVTAGGSAAVSSISTTQILSGNTYDLVLAGTYST